jgi:aminoglycoside phosphotransferase (APT) family kinase protein
MISLQPTWSALAPLMIRPFANRGDFTGRDRKAQADIIRTVGRQIDTIKAEGYPAAAQFTGRTIDEAEAMIRRLESKRRDIDAELRRLSEWAGVLDGYIAKQSVTATV